MNYLAFIIAYPILFWFLEFIPIMIDFDLAIIASFTLMVIVFLIINWKYEGFNNRQSYIIHLVAIFILAVTTIVYESLHQTRIIGTNISYLSDYSFYHNTLSLNHSVLLATLIFLAYALVKKNWMNVLFSLSHIVTLLIYLYIVV